MAAAQPAASAPRAPYPAPPTVPADLSSLNHAELVNLVLTLDADRIRLTKGGRSWQELRLECTRQRFECDRLIAKLNDDQDVKNVQGYWFADAPPEKLAAQVGETGEQVKSFLKEQGVDEKIIRDVEGEFKQLKTTLSMAGAAALLRQGILKLIAVALNAKKSINASGIIEHITAMPDSVRRGLLVSGLILSLGVTAAVLSWTWGRFKEMKEIEKQLAALSSKVTDMFGEILNLRAEPDIRQFLDSALTKLAQIKGILEEADDMYRNIQDLGRQAMKSKILHKVGLGFAIGGTVIAAAVGVVAIVASAGVAAPAVAAAATAIGASEGALVGGVGVAGAVGIAGGAGGITGHAIGIKWNSQLLALVTANRYHLKSMVQTVRDGVDFVEGKMDEF